MAQETPEDLSQATDNTKKSIIWFTLLPLLLQIVKLGNSIALARLLSPHDFGVMGIVTVITYYANNISNFGIGNAIVQRQTISQSHYDAFFSFNFAISCFLYILFFLLAPSISNFFEEPDLTEALRAVSLVFLITILFAVPQAELQRTIKYQWLAAVEAVKVFVALVVSLYLALNDGGYWSLVWALVLSNLVVVLIIHFFTKVSPRLKFHMESFKDLMGFGKWSFFSGQVNMVGENIDKLVIGKFLGTESLGYYDKAFGFAMMPNEQFSKRLSSVGFSAYSRSQEDLERLHFLITKILTINAFICFPTFIGLALVAESFTVVVLGDVWIPMIPALVLLSFSFLVAGMSGALFTLNMASGHFKAQSLLRALCVIFLIIVLISFAELGIEAVAVGLLSFNCLSLVFSIVLAGRKLSLPVSVLFRSSFPAAISATLMASVILGVQNLMQGDAQWQILLASVLSGAVVYTVSFLTFPFKQWEFLRAEVFKRLKGILRKFGLAS